MNNATKTQEQCKCFINLKCLICSDCLFVIRHTIPIDISNYFYLFALFTVVFYLVNILHTIC